MSDEEKLAAAIKAERRHREQKELADSNMLRLFNLATEECDRLEDEQHAPTKLIDIVRALKERWESRP